MILRTNINDVREKYLKDNYIAVTIDIDWASEYCIGKIVNYFLENNIPLTVFCTHDSEVINSLKDNDMVELGIHPNFCQGSSQGETIDEVIEFCKKLVPESRCFRSHRWYSSNDVYDVLVNRGIKFDSNDSSMLNLVEPFIHRSGVLRIPTYFEDGGFLWNQGTMNFAEYGEEYFSANGLKVLDLHPIHFAINSPTLEYYRDICTKYNGEKFRSISENNIE